MRRSIRTASFLALCLLPLASCGSPPARKASLPPDPPAELLSRDAEPVWPDLATLLKDDARPAIALLTQGVYAGRDCRTVVAGWQAWWQCQKAAAMDPAVKCDALAEIVKALRKGPGAEAPPSRRDSR
jgi:hypothetical protein